MNKIKRVSRLFRIVFQIMFIALPILVVTAWIVAPAPLLSIQGMPMIDFIPREYTIMHPLSLMTKVQGCIVTLIPTVVELFILFSLIQLFMLYENGEIFLLKNVQYIRNIGYAMLIHELIVPLYEGVMGVILTWGNPPGHRLATMSFNFNDIEMVMTAFIVILISWVMAEACKLREEQQYII